MAVEGSARQRSSLRPSPGDRRKGKIPTTSGQAINSDSSSSKEEGPTNVPSPHRTPNTEQQRSPAATFNAAVCERDLNDDILQCDGRRELDTREIEDPMLHEASGVSSPQCAVMEPGLGAAACEPPRDQEDNEQTAHGPLIETVHVSADSPTVHPCPPEASSPMQSVQANGPELAAAHLQPAAQDYIDTVSMPLQQSAATPMPVSPALRRRRQTTIGSNSLHRSNRIARIATKGTTLDRAQAVLMRKLGVISEGESLSPEAREAYTQLFEHPLSRSHLTALAALFGWTVPPEDEARVADCLVH